MLFQGSEGMRNPCLDIYLPTNLWFSKTKTNQNGQLTIYSLNDFYDLEYFGLLNDDSQVGELFIPSNLLTNIVTF